MTMVLCDTSSAIEMSKRKGRSMGSVYATPGIMAEVERHRNTYRKGKREVSDSVYGSFQSTDSSNRSNFDNVRYDAYWSWLGNCDQKKREIDPMSREDLALVAEAIMQARRGRSVEVCTEDAHISNTLVHMLSNKYSHLNGKVKVRSVAV